MAREAFNQITQNSDSSIGSNGDTHIPTVTVPLVRVKLEPESSSAPVAPMEHQPSRTSKKRKGVVAPSPPPLPPPPPCPPNPNETEVAVSIQQNAVLSAECAIAGVTYSRLGGGSRPHPLAGVTSSNQSYGRGTGAPDPVGASSLQVYHPADSAAQREEYHQPLRGLTTVDYLSQMEAASSLVQVERENLSSEVLAQWGKTLSLGRGKRVDLSLRIGLG